MISTESISVVSDFHFYLSDEIISLYGGQGYKSNRKIINQWIILDDSTQIIKYIPQLGLAPFHQDLNGLIGFVYVDNEAGISCKILFQCDILKEQNLSTLPFYPIEHVGITLRYSVIEILNYLVLSDNERRQYNLPEYPDWIYFYQSSDIAKVRSCTSIDRFRAISHFDDLQVIAYSSILKKVELLWVRMKAFNDKTGHFQGILNSEPYDDFGIHKGEEVLVGRTPGEKDWALQIQINEN